MALLQHASRPEIRVEESRELSSRPGAEHLEILAFSLAERISSRGVEAWPGKGRRGRTLDGAHPILPVLPVLPVLPGHQCRSRRSSWFRRDGYCAVARPLGGSWVSIALSVGTHAFMALWSGLIAFDPADSKRERRKLALHKELGRSQDKSARCTVSD